MRKSLLIGLVLVWAALLAGGLWMQQRQPAAKPGEGRTVLVPATLALEGLQTIELAIGSPETPQLRLARSPEQGWRVTTVQNALADRERLTSFVHSLRGLAGEERARGAKWFDAFGVGSRAASIRLTAGETSYALVVGRSGKDPLTNFARRPEEEVIYAVDEDLLGGLGLWGSPLPEALPTDAWVDRRLVPLELAAVASVEVAERAGEQWVVRAERHAPFDGAARDWLQRLTASRATSVADPSAAFTSSWRWIVTTKDDQRYEVEEPAPAAEGGETITARRLPDDVRLTLSSQTLASLRQEIIPAPAPAKTTKPAKKPSAGTSPARR